MSDKRTGWLAELKVGDWVFIDRWPYSNLRKIEKITPTGRITVDGIVFNSGGWAISGSDSRLSAATKEKVDNHRIAVKRRNQENHIRDCIENRSVRDGISNEDIDAVCQILAKYKKEQV